MPRIGAGWAKFTNVMTKIAEKPEPKVKAAKAKINDSAFRTLHWTEAYQITFQA